MVPATNFTAGFPNAGYRGIRKILDDNKINYTRKTIIQASELKDDLERLSINRSDYTIFSMDAISMYPSVKFSMVKLAVAFFARDLKPHEKTTINRCLDMIRFGMGHTLLNFQDEYWEYGGDKSVEERGLTIGGYESAWLADLVAAYILENSTELFEMSKYYGIYRDDGLTVMIGRHSKSTINEWLIRFQAKVDELCESPLLRFTVDIWDAGGVDDGIDIEGVTYTTTDCFPYLDTELYWKDNALQFRVHMNKNQQLKYLNQGSAHTQSCFKAIPHGVMTRLAKLTTRSAENENTPIDVLYPKHADALRKSHLAPKTFPTLGTLINTREERIRDKEILDEEREEGMKTRSRQTFFCIGVSNVWTTPISQSLKKLRNEHGLKWLRPSMSYHKFSNLREKFSSDVTTKLMRGTKDLEETERPCPKALPPQQRPHFSQSRHGYRPY